MGLLGVVLKLIESVTHRPTPQFAPTNPLYNRGVSVVAFLALAYSLYYFARKPLASSQALEELAAGD